MKDQRRTGSSRDFRPSTINCPLTPSNPFRITYIRKNAPANPYGSHIYKTKDLKSFRITYLQKKGGWRGPGHRCPARKRGSHRVSNSAFRISIVNFRLSTVDCQLSALSPLTSTLTKNASATPLTSTLTKKGWGVPRFPLSATSRSKSPVTNQGPRITGVPLPLYPPLPPAYASSFSAVSISERAWSSPFFLATAIPLERISRASPVRASFASNWPKWK